MIKLFFVLIALLLERANSLEWGAAFPNTKATNSAVNDVDILFRTTVALVDGDTITVSANSGTPAVQFFTGTQAATAYTFGTCTLTPQAPDASNKVVIKVTNAASSTCNFVSTWHSVSLVVSSGNLGSNPASGTVNFIIQTSKEATDVTGTGWTVTDSKPGWTSATPSSFGSLQSLYWIQVKFTPTIALASGDFIGISASPSSVISAVCSTITTGSCTLSPFYDSNVIIFVISGAGCNLAGSSMVTLNMTSTSTTTPLGTNPSSATGSNVVTFSLSTSKENDLTGQSGWTVVANSPIWGAAAPSSAYASAALTYVAVTFTPRTTLVSGDTFTVTASPNSVFTGTPAASTVTTASTCTFSSGAPTAGAIVTTLGNSGTSTCSMNSSVAHLITFKPANNGTMGTNPASGAVTFSLVTSKDSTAITNQTGWTVLAAIPSPSPNAQLKLTSSGMYFYLCIIALLFTV